MREFGLAIRDLAQANIFAGDLLLKNFGITGRGRVVFYDYDEISLLTEVTFRRVPSARDDAEEASAEPWFHVGPRDVFPEEFLRFLFPPGRLRELFLEIHGELLDPAWWIARQEENPRGKTGGFHSVPGRGAARAGGGVAFARSQSPARGGSGVVKKAPRSCRRRVRGGDRGIGCASEEAR